MKSFRLSAMLSSLPLEFAPAAAKVTDLGFEYVDVTAMIDRPDEHREALAQAGVGVSCAALARGLPDRHSLDAVALEVRRTTLDLVKRQIADAALLGATHAYLVPPLDSSPEALLRFAESCSVLGEYAMARQVRLCVEPVPKRALATATAALDWLAAPLLAEVHLLLDLGHCLISKENPAEIVHRAGPRLGYVHLDDNDGINDVHWALFTGCLTPAILASFLGSLKEIRYEGTLAFEFNAGLPDPVAALRGGKDAVEQWRQ